MVILYDGVCGLCNRLTRFVLARDVHDRFRFASLQGDLAREVLRRHGKDPTDLDTFYLVLGFGTEGERLLERSTAALRVLSELTGPWRVLSWLRFVPRPLRDLAYRLVARVRYQLFGKYDRCPMPSVETRHRFLG